jgi:pyruvate/2-oxoacid:ferredoxin oxidoreductase alpha subunit
MKNHLTNIKEIIMSKKEKIQTLSWKDIHVVETNDGREVYYFVTPKLEVFMDEDIANIESMINNDYHLADVAHEYVPAQNSKEYERIERVGDEYKHYKQMGYEANAENHSMDCEREFYERDSDEVRERMQKFMAQKEEEWKKQQLEYAKAMSYLPTDGGGH